MTLWCVNAHGSIECPVDCCRRKDGAVNVYYCCGLTDTPDHTRIFWLAPLLVVLTLLFLYTLYRGTQRRRTDLRQMELSPLMSTPTQSMYTSSQGTWSKDSSVYVNMSDDHEKVKKKVLNLSKLLKQQNPDKVYLKVLTKLDGYQMTMEILKETGIGKQVNGLRKNACEEIVKMSKDLVKKWMKLVQEPESRKRDESFSPKPLNKRPKCEKPRQIQVYYYQPIKKQSRPGSSNVSAKSSNTWGIYSGNKRTALSTLKELSVRILTQHVSTIYHVGNLDYEILAPVLSRCTAEQLNLIEYRNPHLCGKAEGVWKVLVEQEFRTHTLQGDCWKTMYWDKVVERKEKFKKLTNSISAAKYQKEKGVSVMKHISGPVQGTKSKPRRTTSTLSKLRNNQ